VPLKTKRSSAELAKAFKRRGIKTMAARGCISVEVGEKGRDVKVSGPEGDVTLPAEQALVETGSSPTAPTWGWKGLG